MLLYIDNSDERLRILMSFPSFCKYTVITDLTHENLPPCIAILSPSRNPEYIETILPYFAAGTVLFTGQESASLANSASIYGIKLINVSNDEAYAAKNAYITAEGALAALMHNTPKTLPELTVAVVGYGSIGKELVRILSLLSANVIVFSAKATVTPLVAGEIYPYSELSNRLSECDVLINTAPAQLVSCDAIDTMKHDALLLELASAPYGYSSDYVISTGRRSLHLPGLPGKTAPYSAAVSLAYVVEKHLVTGGYI